MFESSICGQKFSPFNFVSTLILSGFSKVDYFSIFKNRTALLKHDIRECLLFGLSMADCPLQLHRQYFLASPGNILAVSPLSPLSMPPPDQSMYGGIVYPGAR